MPTSPRLKRILVTGISGNLGRRLAPLLGEYDLISVDLHPPRPGTPAGKFVQLDLSSGGGQRRLAEIVEEEGPDAVLHLAFVLDPLQTGIVDVARMWEANVGGVKRLLEAIALGNRNSTRVQLFVFLSSVSTYGPDLLERVREDAPLKAHTLPYAIHKREADLLCQRMYPSLNGCAVYLYRPHIYAGATVDNYILRAIRGRPSGRGWLARLYQARKWKFPALLPEKSAGGLLQFVHVDDVARVLQWTLTHFRPGALEIFNLAGSGPALSFEECVRLANTPILRVGSTKRIEYILRLIWVLGLSGVPPEAIPYYLTSYTMDTTRLEEELGAERDSVVQFSSREALLDGLKC
jgi:nucleoside-diphosphate-sugar epimerase